ncbi:hypothetical protein DsansV1_C21g0167261 [Dioscorea sansibarensis]
MRSQLVKVCDVFIVDRFLFFAVPLFSLCNDGVAARMACSSVGNRCSRSPRGKGWCGRRGGVLVVSWTNGESEPLLCDSIRLLKLGSCRALPISLLLLLLLPILLPMMMMLMMILINRNAALLCSLGCDDLPRRVLRSSGRDGPGLIVQSAPSVSATWGVGCKPVAHAGPVTTAASARFELGTLNTHLSPRCQCLGLGTRYHHTSSYFSSLSLSFYIYIYIYIYI